MSSLSLLSTERFWNDAVGPVKEIKLQTDDPIATRKTIKFSKNGKENKSLMTYNDAGYPTGFGLQMGERESTLKIYYNTENLVDSLKFKSTLTGNGGSLRVFNSYNDKGELIHRVIDRTSNKKREDRNTLFDYTFSDFIVDAASNWISRSVVLEITDRQSGNVDRMEYTETRTIKYYQEDN